MKEELCALAHLSLAHITISSAVAVYFKIIIEGVAMTLLPVNNWSRKIDGIAAATITGY